MNNALNRDLVITNVAASYDFVCVNLATGASIMRLYLHYFFPHQVIENFQNGKDRNGILFLGDMVTILITASEVLYDFCE
jgi:hypothetical protein